MLDDLYCHKNTHNSVVFFSCVIVFFLFYFILSHDLKTTRWQGSGVHRALQAYPTIQNPNPKFCCCLLLYFTLFYFILYFFISYFTRRCCRPARCMRGATIAIVRKRGIVYCTLRTYVFIQFFVGGVCGLCECVYVMHSFLHSFYVVQYYFMMEVFTSSISVWQRNFCSILWLPVTLKPQAYT